MKHRHLRSALAILAMSFASFGFSQTDEFCGGWTEGYKQGWCYGQGYGCMDPMVPMCPMRNMGETTYQHGYNRGFSTAQAARSRSMQQQQQARPGQVQSVEVDGYRTPVATQTYPVRQANYPVWQPVDPAIKAARRQERMDRQANRYFLREHKKRMAKQRR